MRVWVNTLQKVKAVFFSPLISPEFADWFRSARAVNRAREDTLIRMHQQAARLHFRVTIFQREEKKKGDVFRWLEIEQNDKN